MRSDTLAIDLHYDLRSPCDDCPFRTDAPFHDGVVRDLLKIDTSLKAETFAHSCHKTDPRADCAPEKRAPSGPVQHCAGALIMLEKMGKMQLPAAMAFAGGRYDPGRLNMKAPVFDSFNQMLLYYAVKLARRHPEIPESKSILDSLKSKETCS